MTAIHWAAATGGTFLPAVSDGEPAWARTLRARDEDAWRALHEREFAFLYRFALGMGADGALAEDAASEAFTRLVAGLPRLRLSEPIALRSEAAFSTVAPNTFSSRFRTSGLAR